MPITDPMETAAPTPAIVDPLDAAPTRDEQIDFKARNAMAFELGVAPDEIDTQSGAGFLDRLDFSFSDNDAEIVAKFKAKYPNGVIRRVVVPDFTKGKSILRDEGGKRLSYSGGQQRELRGGPRLVFKFDQGDPDEKLKTIEDYGRVSLGDVADLGGPTAKVAPAVAASFLVGPGALPQAAAAFGGTAVGHLAKEGVEEARGYQLQPWSEVAKQALGEGAAAGAMAGGLGLARNAINVGTGGGLLNIAPEDRAAQARIASSGLNLEPLTAPQLAPEHKVLQRLSRQAASTSTQSQQQVRLQEMSAEQALRSLKDSANATDIGRQAMRATEKTFREKWFKTLKADRGFVSPEKGGKALQGAGKDFVSGSRNVVRAAYDKADAAASKNPPIFDLSPAVQQVDDIERAVLGAVPEGEAAVNVAGTPRGELLGVIRDIKALAPEQTNYEVVKQLRTRLFDLIDNHPWNWDFNKHQALNLYKTLTGVLERPANGAPEFVQAFKTANQAAAERFSILERPSLQRIIKADQPAKLASTYALPGQFTDEVYQALRTHSSAKLKQFQRSAQLQILQKPGGAMKAVTDWIRRDPDGFSRIVPSAERKVFLDTAQNIDRLGSDKAVALLNQQTRASQFVRTLLKDQDPAGIDEAIRGVGGHGTKGHKLLRAGAIEDTVASVTEKGPRGYLVVDQAKLKSHIESMKKSGVWEKVLTREDRTKLTALDDYTRLLQSGKDVGTSLEAAQEIGKLKHPTTFLSGLHQLSMNSLIARFLVSPASTKFLIGGGRQFDLSTVRRLGLVVGTIADDIEAGEQGPAPLAKQEPVDPPDQ